MQGFQRLSNTRLIPQAGGNSGTAWFMPSPIERSWEVPEGATSLCAVLVGPGNQYGSHTYLHRNDGTIICSAYNHTGGVKQGGGNGGAPTNRQGTSDWAGGAGGYSGDGGSAQYSGSPTSGSGGAGGGGFNRDSFEAKGAGGGVGLWGEGPSGALNEPGSWGYGPEGALNGYDDQQFAPFFGGGTPGLNYGGELSWMNAIPVSPGEILKIGVGRPNGGAALYWGYGEFPLLEGFPKGYQ